MVRETDDDGTVYTFRWACNLTYRTHTLHAIVCDAYRPTTGKTNRFMYLTDIRPDATIVKKLINLGGRQRFKIENIGFNVLTSKYVDMIQAGVIDPVKVVRGALENAASIASMILTTDVLITDMPEKDKAPAMPPGGMGGMDY